MTKPRGVVSLLDQGWTDDRRDVPPIPRPVVPVAGAAGEREHWRPEALGPDAVATWEALAEEPRGVEQIARGASMPVGRVLAALADLEMGGHVDKTAGMRFSRAGPP